MNEYSFLLKDSKGVYTIQDEKLQLIDYDGHYEDFNYGFFNINDITLPRVFDVLEGSFTILICERVKSTSPIMEVVADKEVDYSIDRYGLQLANGKFVLPNGCLLDEDCDVSLLPTDITEYTIPLESNELQLTQTKKDGMYIFYSATLDKREWDNITRIEAIE